MKKILFALGMMMTFGYSASAQDSRYAKNYKVCRTETGYGVCTDQEKSNLNGENAPTLVDHKQVLVPCYSPTNVVSGPPMRPMPKEVQENAMDRQSDGMEQNNKRNLNVSNNVSLAPNNGEIR